MEYYVVEGLIAQGEPRQAKAAGTWEDLYSTVREVHYER